MLHHHWHTSFVLLTHFNMMLMWRWELIEWWMMSWNWSVELCQLTVTESTMSDWTIAMCPHDCRWLYCTAELNNGLVNIHLTLEAFAVLHILKSFPQLKCEMHSLIHRGADAHSRYISPVNSLKAHSLIEGCPRNEMLFANILRFMFFWKCYSGYCVSITKICVAAAM